MGGVGQISEKFPGDTREVSVKISVKFRRGPYVKTDIVTRDTRIENFLKRLSRDEFYGHTGFTC